ncbi:MAG: helix-turn-helix transcriptional regulator [Bacteroidales bacterium]
MTLGQHITSLRKAKKYSQSELVKKAGTSGDIIGHYERDEVKPSIEVIIKIADALTVSIDYLVDKTDFELDNDTLKRIHDVSTLPAEEKKQVFMVIDALIRDFKTRRAYVN